MTVKAPQSTPERTLQTASQRTSVFSYEDKWQHWQPARQPASVSGAIFGSALEALQANRVRSFLTMLGMIIGVSAVIAVITLTQGVDQSVNERFASLGTNVLTISPGASSGGGVRSAAGSQQTLTLEDAQAVAQLPHVANMSPVLNANGQVIYNDQNWNTGIRGVYPAYQVIQNWQIASGTWFSDSDEQMALPVAVLGQTVVANLFPDSTDPIGQTIRINSALFRIVGVLQPKGSQGAANADDVIFVPFSAARERLTPTTYVNQIQVQVDDQANATQTQIDIMRLLRSRHHLLGPDPALTAQGNALAPTQNRSNLSSGLGGGGGNGGYRGGNGGAGASNGGAGGSSSTNTGSGQRTTSRSRAQRTALVPDDFQVFNQNQLIATAQQNSAELTVLLIGIAAISLTTGGIGIMNIMLVSVTERIREIGLRMALGARQGDIRNQFLLEALVLSIVGGIVGIIIGVLGGIALTLGLGFPFVLSAIPIAVAFSVSALVGIAFGFYPAVRASRLDPIIALQTPT